MNTSDRYGNWTVECWVCHSLHHQEEAILDADYTVCNLNGDALLYSGTTDAVTETTITDNDADWPEDGSLEGMRVCPNTEDYPYCHWNYKIVSNTATVLTVEGPIDIEEIQTPERVDPGANYSIFLGKLMPEYLDLPWITDPYEEKPKERKYPKLLRRDGPNSYADGDTVYDGICEVCHTMTRHFKNDGTAVDQKHTNLSEQPVAGSNCIRCHSHENGFAHGGGPGTGCVECHGHDAGSNYDLDMRADNGLDLSGTDHPGRGSFRSHSTHTESNSIFAGAYDDDQRGPGIYCDTCHNISSIPYFKSGADSNGDGRFDLSETDVCDNCHSSGGTYNGVDTVQGSIGAKDNWKTGVYKSDGTLQPGREKWCAGCHDEEPSSSNADGTGVRAPNIVGDEDGEFNYGTGWGFYKTGHGVPDFRTYPASGGITSGAAKICSDCHDQTTPHLDGDSRTFDCDNSTGGACSSSYKDAYRLKDVDGALPMQIPQTGRNLASYLLCLNCHTNTADWLSSDSTYRDKTNFYDVDQSPGKKNLHIFHLGASQGSELDWDAGTDGAMSCITCHNVHGSRNPVMIRSGELTGWPSMTVRYGNTCSTHTAGQVEPVPNDVTLALSTRSTMMGGQASPYCSHCHGIGTGIVTVARSPADLANFAPELNWVGGPAFESDGVNPDAAPSGTRFTFRVEYSDVNQDGPPDIIQLWIDRNGDGSYVDHNADPSLDEIIDMTSAFAEPDTCATYNSGVDYVTTMTLEKALLGGGSTITYKFYAVYGGMEATGPPTYGSTLTLLNDVPTLDWTGESNYESDGVEPDYGPQDGNYAFRVKYIDNDGDACPVGGTADIQILIDLDRSGTYDPGEMFNLVEDSAADTDCTSAGGGKLYYTEQVLPNNTGSIVAYNYRFHASDGTDDATGAPVSPGGTVTVSGSGNNPPFLAWDSGVCRPEGAMPPRNALSSSISFSVRYYDEDNECPTGGTADIQVYVDLDNSGTYTGEQFNLDEADTGDADCTTAGGGKLYTVDVTPTAVANDIIYEFHATDGTDEALGDPRTVGSTVDVIDADLVVRQDGTEDYTTISAAVSSSSSGDTILVYDGIYDEYVSKGAGIYYNMNLYSACGPAETIISNTNDPVVYVYRGGNSVIDGFTVTGSSGTGISAVGNDYDLADSHFTVNNCIVRDNNGRGVAGYRAQTIITDCEIYGNQGGGVLSYAGSVTDTVIRNNSVTGNGGGIASEAENGTFTLNNVIITDNTATGNGGGIYCDVTSSYSASYEKVTLAGNTSGTTGGGGYFTYCYPTFTNSLVSDNSAPSGGGIGVGIWAGAWFENSTIVNNTATTGDGGAFNSTDGAVSLANSIAWGNRASGNGHIGYFSGSSKTIYLYDSIIENNGDENITDDNYFVAVNNSSVNDTGTNYDTYPNFVNPHSNGDYHIQAPSDAIDQAADHSGRGIPADDLEGNSRPAGSEDIGAYETLAATGEYPPVLAWTGQEGYVDDGVNPDYGAGGTGFEFRVEYSHVDNIAPSPIEVWVDLNGNDAFEGDEKFPMDVLASGDTYDDGDYVNGERYTKTLTVYTSGGSYVKYRFYASDGQDLASEEPTMTHTLYVENSAPVLAWAGDANYESDGVHPNTADPGSAFVFRVLYTDLDNFDNEVPPVAQVWIDLDDDGSYESGTELIGLTPEAGADDYHDGDFTNGEIFVSAPITLNFAGDGILAYRFSFSDGVDSATGAPNFDKIVTLTNTPPSLDWTGETNFAGDGVDPDTGNSGDSYEFRIDYFDANNTPPSAIQVWIDLDDSSTYASGEKYALTEVDSGDTTYTDGKRYALSKNIAHAGDGILNYRFYATDGRDDAAGTPVSTGGTLQVAEGLVEVNFTAAAQTTDESAASYTITAQLDAAIGDDVTVPFTVTGTATGGGTDYTITASPITITAGQLFADITVDVAADLLDEDDETVIVTMGDPTNAVKGTMNVHTLTITDDDPEPSVTFTSASQATADESGDCTITAQLSTASGRDVTVPFTVNAGSTATGGGTDYSITASPITITAGNTTADITVTIAADSLDENDETVIVDMGAPVNATPVGTTSHMVTITDDDPMPSVTFTSASQVTTNESGTYAITAQLSAVSGRVVSVPYSLGGSAEVNVDYTIAPNPLSISAGATSADITVAILTDGADEGDETVVVTMDDPPTNATLGATTVHTLTITDDDAGGGTTLTVCASGADYTTIQTAIDAAANGDTVLVCDGTYSENINFIGKNITVRSENGAGSTMIQGATASTNAPVVTFANTETAAAVLDGFTIDNQAAAGSLTRGIAISGSAAPTLKNLAVKGNNTITTWVQGAGIYISGGTATIETSTIGDATLLNDCQNGCGIYASSLTGDLSISGTTIQYHNANIGSGIYLTANTTYTTTVANSTLNNNIAGNTGGAIYINASKAAVTGSTVISNSSTNAGGAIYATGTATVLTVSDTDFTGNAAAGSGQDGGAIYFTGSTAASPLTISGGTFSSNSANDIGGTIYLAATTNTSTVAGATISGSSAVNAGGAIYTSSPLTVTDTTISGTTVSSTNDAFRADGASAVVDITGGSISNSSGMGLKVQNGAAVTVTGTTIGGNGYSNTPNLGGGISITTSGAATSLTLDKAYLQGNRAAQRGGGLHIGAGTAVTVTNSIISGNSVGTSNWEEGGGIRNYGTLNISSSTIAGNYAAGRGGGLYTDTGTATATNSIFWDNTGGVGDPEIRGTATVTYSNVEGGYTGTGNINLDPVFVTPAQAGSGTPTTAGDFHICNGSGDPWPLCETADTSAAIDAGDDGTNIDPDPPTVDIDDQSRPAGSGYDMGADEYHQI